MKNKVLYITNGVNGPGGLERVLSIKASYLAEHYDYDVHIITLNQGDASLFYEFSPKIKFHDVKSEGNKISYLYQYIKGMRRQIKKINPDVISVCDDGLKGLLLPILTGRPCPMIYERHVSKNIEIKSDKQSVIRKVITSAKFALMAFGGKFYDAFVVLTNGNKKEWNLKNVVVIPNPLSFYPGKEKISTLTNKKVLAVGKQCFQKGYDRLLLSWQSVVKQFPDWSLDIYGTISEDEGLDALSNKLGLDTSVNFHRPVKNINEKYKEASIYVMSSRYEGFGMVLTEAMAYGVPCVSFDCPYGPSDIIHHDDNGLLVENNDIEGLAGNICDLIENEEKRARMGEKARIDVQRYLPKKIAKEWDTLFKRLISRS